MFRFSGRFKKIFLLFLLGGGFLYLCLAVSRTTESTWYQRAARTIVLPLARSLRATSGYLHSIYENYFALRGAHEENERLKGEMSRLRMDLLRSQEETHRLRQQLQNWEKLPQPWPEGQIARVIGIDPSPTSRSLTIDKGSQDGVAEDGVVVSEGGVVGRILRTAPNSSQVLLVTDTSSAVDVLSQNTRARGTLVGRRRKIGLNRDRDLTAAEHVRRQEEIRPGDLLLTSGLDGVFPPGLPVGVVRNVVTDESGLFWDAEVEPAVEFNKLEQVVVLHQTTDNRQQTTDLEEARNKEAEKQR